MPGTTPKHSLILIPIDFTEQSLLAIKQSYNLAKYTHSKILLLHVYESQGQERFEEISKLSKLTQEESGVETDFMNVKGNIYKEAVRVAEELEATMIIVGLESHMGAKDMIGASASKFIRESPCPVISIRGRDHRDGCENILLPLDLTKESRQKVDKAIEFAKYFGAAIRILGVFSTADEKYENQLHAYAHQVKQYIKSKGIACTNKTLAGDNIAETVVEYANKIEADLIMIMTKTDLNMKEFFVGTTAQRVIDISNIPVLSIRPIYRPSINNGIIM
ncbi:MAG: universal stress protein [Bacteroidetes bacterium]|nr:universal stress protein [Bacteroidota bacterium]